MLGGAGSLTVLDDGAHDTIQAGSGTTNVTLNGSFGRTRGGTGNFTVDDPTANSTVIGGTADTMFVTVGAARVQQRRVRPGGQHDILDLGADALIGAGDGTSVVSIAGAGTQLYGTATGSGTLNVSIGAANALVFGLGDNTTVDASSAAATGALVFGGFSSIAADNGSLLVQGGQDFLVAITGGSNSTINAGTGGLYAYIGTGSLAGSNVINAASASALYVAFIGGAGSATVFGGEAAASVFGVDGTDATYVNSLAGAPGAYLVANGSAAGGETLNAAGSATERLAVRGAGQRQPGGWSGQRPAVRRRQYRIDRRRRDGRRRRHADGQRHAVRISCCSPMARSPAGRSSSTSARPTPSSCPATTPRRVGIRRAWRWQGAMETGGNTTIALADGTHITFVDATTADLQGHVFSN